MTDFSFIQYIANPYALIAVVCGILGFSFRVMVNKIEKPSAKLLVAMYGMFTATILALGLGGLAISLLLGGATDTLPGEETAVSRWEIWPTAYAQEEELFSAPAQVEEHLGAMGWIWAGATEKTENNETELDSKTLFLERAPKNNRYMIIKNDTYLRDAPPYFQWFFFRWKLGDLMEVLPKGQMVRVLAQKQAGWQLWLQVQVVESRVKEEDIPQAVEQLKMQYQEECEAGEENE